MQTRRQLGSQLAALSAVMTTYGFPARAAEQTLRFGSISGAGTGSYAGVLEPFARAVERDSGGRLEMALKPAGGYGKPVELFPMVEKGTIEMAATVQGYHPGRFPQSTVIELPMQFDNALTGTRALQGLLKEGLLDKDYATVKVIALYAVPPFGIFTTGKKVTSVKDLRGLRIRTPGPTVGLPLARLGAIPLGMPASQIGDAIANGTIDAMAFSMESALTTKGAGDKFLAEQMSVAVDLRFAAPAQMVVMNRGIWDALPADLKAVLEKNASDLALIGASDREASEVVARKKFQADPRYTYIAVSDEQRAEFEHAMKPAFDDWKANMTRLGIDGDRLLTRTRELVKQFAVAAK